MGRFITLAMMVLAVPAFAAAQHGGRGGGGSAAAAAPGRAATAIPRAAPAPAHANARPQAGGQSAARIGAPGMRGRNNGRGGNRGNTPGLGFDQNFNGTGSQNVPGLGFDYPHLAAINGNRHGRGGGRFDNGFSGFLLSPPVILEDGSTADSQPTDMQPTDGQTSAADEQDSAGDAPPMQRAPRRSRAAEPQVDSAPPAPPREVEQYVFVRRDGSLLFAVAYTWDKGTIRYITPDGLRRSVASDALDLHATQQFNEQRGVDFRAPA
jgi:hypothetical protein